VTSHLSICVVMSMVFVCWNDTSLLSVAVKVSGI
jgi:hypothetical protein